MTWARRSPRAMGSLLLAAVVATAALFGAVAGPSAAETVELDSAAASTWDPWRHHPVLVAEPDIRPVLLRWYELKLSEEKPDRSFTSHTVYLPGGAKAYMGQHKYPYDPLEDAAARDRLVGWDLLKLPGHGPMTDDWLKLFLNRDATLCVALRYNTGEEVNVPGYTLWGVAVVPEEDQLVREGKELPGRAGLWCKVARAGLVQVPRGPPMGITSGRENFYSFDIYLGEADGSAPAPPAVAAALNGVKIWPNSQCPQELHDLWMTPNVDGSDEDTAGKSWRTWHPQVDPVYWCYYGHEHGTAPHFMAPYAPRLDYTAWKNKRQDESHPGFKGYGMVAEDGTAYYLTVHASTSELLRIRQRFHTVTLAAVTRDGEIVADLSIKGDFGPAFALPTDFRRNRTKLPVGGESQAALLAEFEAVKKNRPRMSKRINVFSGDYDNTDMEVDREDLPNGRYEEWSGGLGLCTTSENRRGLILDIKDPISACPNRECAVTGGLTPLAPKVDRPAGVSRANRGVHRILRFDNVSISRNLCDVYGLDDSAGDVFYTNAYGTELADGPGPDAVRQVLKVGWSGSLDGRWTTHDDWYRMMRSAPEDDAEGGGRAIEESLTRFN